LARERLGPAAPAVSFNRDVKGPLIEMANMNLALIAEDYRLDAIA
jgi:hypothetical protein